MANRLTAREVETQQFRKKWRGLDPEEVRYYLKSVAEELERLNLQNGDLHEQLGRLRSRNEELKASETVLQETLVTAQRMTEELKDRAQAEADLIIRQARMQAERAMQDSQDQLSKLESEIGRSKLEKELFEKRLRCTLEEHITLLDQRRQKREAPDNIAVLPRKASTDHRA